MKLGFLSNRMELSDKDKRYFQSLQKGYEGEVIFDSLLKDMQSEIIVLNDLLLNYNNSTFQIDSLIISSDQIFLLEIKNYQGNYRYDSGQIYTLAHTEVVNPINQLNRSKFHLRQLLISLGFQIEVIEKVVFIHPNFTLYQAPLDQPFIFPTQVRSFLKQINDQSRNISKRHMELAEKIHSLHIADSPFTQLPAYNFEQLKKGITCAQCNSFSLLISGRDYYCEDCHFKEKITVAVLRSAEEFNVLFPDKKITTSVIYEWCKIIPSKSRIRRILAKHYNQVGNRKWTYYEKKSITIEK